jgi:hypothetical protein
MVEYQAGVVPSEETEISGSLSAFANTSDEASLVEASVRGTTTLAVSVSAKLGSLGV